MDDFERAACSPLASRGRSKVLEKAHPSDRAPLQVEKAKAAPPTRWGPDGQIMTCHRCGSERHLIADCQQKGKGKGKGSSHLEEGLFAGYGGGTAAGWPSDGAGSAIVSGVSVAAEHYSRSDNDVPLVLFDQKGDEIPAEVAEPYRATSQWQVSVRSLVELYDSTTWTLPSALPTSGQESHSWLSEHQGGVPPPTGVGGEQDPEDDGDAEE